MTKTLVRFHLAQGPMFKNWQVKCGETVEYYNPEDVVLRMNNCKLRNHPTTANRIHNGANKTVCAWIECDSVDVQSSDTTSSDVVDHLYYNPRTLPHWRNTEGLNCDNGIYLSLQTQDTAIVILKE